MSIEALNWAWEQTDITPAQKLILLTLADVISAPETVILDADRICDKACITLKILKSSLLDLSLKSLVFYQFLSSKQLEIRLPIPMERLQ